VTSEHASSIAQHAKQELGLVALQNGDELITQEVVPVAAGPSGSRANQTDRWPEASWHRLIKDLVDPSQLWATVPRCSSCGRALAAPDCEPDPRLCWTRVSGCCR